MYESKQSQLHLIDTERQIYRLQCIVGKGKFGIVYKGYDNQNKRPIALKYLQNNTSEAWKKQIKALQKFDHPNIIKYYGFVEDKCIETNQIIGVYLVTEFVRGKTLSQYISSASKVRQKGLSEVKVLKIFYQLLKGYQHMHSQQFMHRDIKPQNILIDDNQNVKIIDLGQSKERKLIKTKGTGTPLYSAPQALTGENLKDLRRDVWSLGLVLYQMITGKCYFAQWLQCGDQDKFKNFLKNHKIKIKYPSNFNSFWAKITYKMLEKNYNARRNLHQILYQFQTQLPSQLRKKLNQINSNQSVNNTLAMSVASGNTNPLIQSQNQFQLSRTKKYLKFFKNKHTLLIFLTEMLTKLKYPFLSNAHKLIVVFLSFCIYSASIDHLLKRLERDRITITQNEKFNVQDFEQPYQTAMKSYLVKQRQYYQKELKITRNTITQRIIPKFFCDSKSSSSETDSLSSGNSKQIFASELIEQFKSVKQVILDYKEGINYPKSRYVQIFNQVINHQDYYQLEQNIRKYFYQQDMVVYYLFLVICNIDKMLCWSNDYLGDQIAKLKQQLYNFKRKDQQIQQMIEKIKRLNFKH